MNEKLTFRQSHLALFMKSPSEFLKRWNDKDFKPNASMLFGTKMHSEREKENGKYAEIKIIIDMDICNLSGTLDKYDGIKITDYKYTGTPTKWEGYKNQIAIYQYMIWKRDGVLVPAVLEMIEVIHNPFAEPEFSLSGLVKNYDFKRPTITDLKIFEKKVVSSLRQMIYLTTKPKHPKSNYTKEELIEMSEMLPDEMRTKNFIRNKTYE